MSRTKQAAGMMIAESAIFEKTIELMKEAMILCEAGGKPSLVLKNLNRMKTLTDAAIRVTEQVLTKYGDPIEFNDEIDPPKG